MMSGTGHIAKVVKLHIRIFDAILLYIRIYNNLIRDLKHLYVAIKCNKVVVWSTNLTKFVSKMKEIEPGINSLSYYQKTFAKTNFCCYVNDMGEQYLLQKIL